ncbi:hypothetical protein V5O48_002801 [Marasmius crinis-equi]|uniref:NAD(P)-binding domain-containing protein n=1 Tax=Marasmius crinis-equi TaxID=585013 RepID=A0ABR3FUK0_9AGAR
MSQLTLFGVTGPSGRPLIEQALQRNYTLVIYARNPSKLDATLQDDKRSSAGSLEDYDSILESLKGSHAVIAVLSSTNGIPRWLGGMGSTSLDMTRGNENILKAMHTLGIERFVGTGTPSMPDPQDGFNLLLFIAVRLLALIFPVVYGDIVASGKLLLEWKDRIDWTWIRVAGLKNGSSEMGYRLGYVGDGTKLSIWPVAREELAKCLLDELETGQQIHRMPMIY